MHTHNDLKHRTKLFALAIVKFYQNLPKTTEAQILGKQLLRSGTSVGANTNSAFRGRSEKEYKAKLGVVIEEADESAYWLDLLTLANIIGKEQTEALKNEAEQLVAIFVSIVKR
ncbi:MAG: four helix bundle protein [Flavobacteriales bacterium]|nr:four helix bundle protein [Flavobacteriales bacterium]